MHEKRLFWLLLTPSLSSGIVTLFAATATLIGAGWLYIGHNPFFYDYLFGPNGINTTLLRVPDTTVLVRTWLLGSAATYYIVLLITALIAGLTVFAILQGIRHLVSESYSGWSLLHSHSAQAKSVIREVFARLALRVVSCLIWCLYIVFSTTVLVPFAMVLLQSGIDVVTKNIGGGLFNIFASFVTLAVFVHVHIVFLRLILLRPRLFGTRDIELAELQEA